MNLAAMRTMVKRRLLQPAAADAGEWTDAELTVLINEAYRATVLMALEADPKCIVEEATTALVKDQHTYEWPADMIYDQELAILDSSTGEYVPLDGPLSLQEARLRTSGDIKFCRYGQYIYLAPAPDATVSAGLKLTYTPALGLSTENSVPKLRNAWHILIVVNAQILALGETADQAAPAIAERNSLYATLLGAGRRETGGKPVPMSVGIVRGYGRGSSTSTRR